MWPNRLTINDYIGWQKKAVTLHKLYIKFLPILNLTMERTVIEEEARGQLLRILAFNNANEDYKRALLPIKKTGDFTAYMKACKDIFSESGKIHFWHVLIQIELLNYIFYTFEYSTGILAQDKLPLEWIYVKYGLNKTLSTHEEQIYLIIQQGRQRAITLLEYDCVAIIFPLSKDKVEYYWRSFSISHDFLHWKY